MILSTRSRYGARLLFELAYNYGQGPVMLRDIADRQEISEKYLSKIVLQLKSAGIINSHRGTNGGYELARKPSDINMKEAVEVLEGGFNVAECKGCQLSRRCPTTAIWERLDRVIKTTLEGETLDKMVVEYKLRSGEGVLEYSI